MISRFNIQKLLFILTISFSCWYIFSYIVIALIRSSYPFEIEWMESAVLDHVSRILAGQPLYCRPTVDFVPLIYTPLYYYVSALVTLVTGPGFFPLRTVSFAASLLSVFLIGCMVKKETGKIGYGIIAAGLFLSTYRLSGAWLDIARCDSLCLFILLCALYCIRYGRQVRAWICAGILITLAIQTKQNALVFFLPVIIYSAFRNPKQAITILITAGILTGVILLIAHEATSGWYWYYTFDMPRVHNTVGAQVSRTLLFLRILVKHTPVLIGFSLYLLYYLFIRQTAGLLFSGVAAVASFFCCWWTWLNPAAYHNAFILLFAMSSLFLCIGMDLLSGSHGRSSVSKLPLNRSIGYLLLLLQFSLLLYNPLEQIPSSAAVSEGKLLQEKMAAVEGDVYIPSHGYLATTTGKKGFVHTIALFDLSRSPQVDGCLDSLIQGLIRHVRDKAFSAVILDEKTDFYLQEYLDKYYTLSMFSDSGSIAFRQLTGYRTQPRYLYTPRR